MENIYDRWNRIQKELTERKGVVYCHARDIWWCYIGMNVGSEMYGKNENFERPVIIIKAYKNMTALIVPLTSKPKFGKYYFNVKYNDTVSCAILSQVRTISTKRLSRKIGKISQNDFDLLINKYKEDL